VWSVLNQGLLMQRGMPRYENLTRDQVHALYLVIRAGAREALGQKVVLEEPPRTKKPAADSGGLLGKIHNAYVTVRTLLGFPPEVEDEPLDAAASAQFYHTSKTKIGAILDNEPLRTIVDKHVPGLSGRSQIGLARSMTLKQLQNYSPEFSDEVLAKIDAEFAKLPTPAAKP
jgi:para-nitrobenzyl esterase